jgi:hypothetical protein
MTSLVELRTRAHTLGAEVQAPPQCPERGRSPELSSCKRLRTKHFHGVLAGNQHPHLLKSQYGKVRAICLGHPIRRSGVVGLHHVTGIRGFLLFDPDLIRLHGEVLFGRLRLMGRYYQESFEAALKVPERLVIE